MEEHEFHILRGQRIEEFDRESLIALYRSIEAELPEVIERLSANDMGRLLELEVIEDELMRRNESLEQNAEQ